MANGNLEVWKALVPGRPWVLGIQNQIVSYCGVGICDPLLQNSVSALEPFRYATGLFQWALAAAGGDLTIGQNVELDLFTFGVGDPIPGGWWTQTISDTDLFKAGAPVDRGFMFLGTGLATEALDPFQRGGTGASATDPKLFSAWLSEADDGAGYSFMIQKFHLNYTAIQFTFGDTGTTYRLGVLAFWPQWGGGAGSQTVRNGVVSTPGMYLPFTTAICIGSAFDVKQLTLSLFTGQSGDIQNNGTQPTALAPNGTGTVFAPVRIMVVGYIVCVPVENWCGVPMLTPDEVIMLRQRLGMAVAAPSAPTQPVGVSQPAPMSMAPITQNIPTPG
jgi:hypothetical protein